MIAPYLAATTCLGLVEAVPKRSNCHRRPCNYCAAILGVGLDDALTHVSSVLSSSIIQNIADGQHRCNALILDRALLPPGDAGWGPWSELAFAISTESIPLIIAINKKLGSGLHGSWESGDVFLLPRCLCRQLNMEPTLSNEFKVSNPIPHAGILQGLFRNRYSAILSALGIVSALGEAPRWGSAQKLQDRSSTAIHTLL